MILTETWLTDSISSSELFSSDFLVYRRDRDFSTSLKQRGGGFLIAVRSNIRLSLIKLPSNTNEELFVSVLIHNNEYIFGSVYLPPDATQDKYSYHISSLDVLLTGYPKARLCVAGDYNMPGLSWRNDNGALLPIYHWSCRMGVRGLRFHYVSGSTAGECCTEPEQCYSRLSFCFLSGYKC
ncbi:hypothetical protein QE152_g9227 [Popillia japonica]|uniref:Endonuclease/exonuclease/phosphatase domain-containing protein n=1 Tax=Popillia japonica TaxID=7064 RepID=A0AAW1LVA8_POPJA